VVLHQDELIILVILQSPPSLLAGAFHQRTAVSLFGRCIPSLRPHFLFGRASIAGPLSFRLAGVSHRRAAFSSFGQRISSSCHNLDFYRRICRRSTDLVLLRLPAHSPPIHRFGVASFAGAFAADPPIWCCFVCRRIPRRAATDLALFHLAGAFPADLVSSFAGAFAANPLIGDRSFWPAHPLAMPPSLFLAGASPRRATISLIGRRIPSPCHHRSFWPAHPLAMPPSLFLAGASPRRATIALFGRRIPSPCHLCLSKLVHPLAAPLSLFFGRRIPCRAPIASIGWGIPSPCLHRLSRSAHPIAPPPYRISAGASHRRTSIACLGLRAHSMPHCKTKYQSRDILHASASAASILM
jgi:hypothetical protein